MIIFKRNLVKLVLCLVTSLAFVYTCASPTGDDDGGNPPDTTAPRVVENLLDNGDIVIAFDENIQAGMVAGMDDIVITPKAGGASISIDIEDSQVTIVNRGFRIDPNPALVDGDYTLTLLAGAITNLAGIGNAGFTFDFTIDTMAPMDVSSTLFADGNIVITFNEDIQVVAGKSLTLAIDGGTATNIPNEEVTISGSVLTYNPSSDLMDGTYTLTLTLPVGVVQDLAGNKNAVITSDFPVDTTGPMVVSRMPAMDGTLPADGNIVITFDEEIQAGMGNIMITPKAGGASISIAITDLQVTILGSLLIIDPSDDLTSGEAYTITLPAGVVTDLAGNPTNPEFSVDILTIP